MALPPDPDQLANKIANWPKWATEESINSLSASMGRSNSSLLAAVKKTNELLAKQQSSATKDQTAQKAVIGSLEKSVKAQQSNAGAIKSLSTGLNNIAKGQSAVVAAIRRLESKSKASGAKVTTATGPSAASISLGNRTLSRAVEVGFKSLSQQQSRANALLKSINANTSSGLRGATRNNTATQNTNRRTQSNENQSERLEEILGRRNYRPSRLKSRNDERLDPATKRTSESIRATRQDLRQLKPEQRQAAAKIIAADIKATFGTAAKKPLEEFQKAVKDAGDNTGKLNKAFKDLDKGIKSADTQYKLRPGENAGDMFRRNQAANAGGTENIKRILGGDVKGGILSMVGGMLESFAGSLMLTFGRFAPAVMTAVTALGMAAGAAMKLYEVWQEGAQSTIKAFGSGVQGLATTALSFAISAKTAGLTLEQFNAAIANSGNMAGRLDENIANAGQRFADGARQYLDSARSANFYGQNVEQLMQSYSRAIQTVGQAGLTGADAQATAIDLARRSASDLYRLSQTTGRTVEDLNNAFNQLYQNDMFRAAQQRLLAAGERKASQELETFGRTLAAIGGQFATSLQDELDLAALGGFDPTVFGKATARLAALVPEMGDIIRSEEFRTADSAQQAAMLQPAAARAMQSGLMSPLAAAAGSGDSEARGIADFIRRNAQGATPQQVNQLGNSPTGAGAEAAAAYTESQRKLQQVNAELLKAVEPLMPLFTRLQTAVNETAQKFIDLNETTKKVLIYLAAFGVALAGLGLMSGAGGALRRGAGAAASGLGGMFGGGKGGTPPGPTAPGTPPGPGGPTPGSPAPGTPSATTPPKPGSPAPGTPSATTPPKPGTPGAPAEPAPPRPTGAPAEPVPPKPSVPGTPAEPAPARPTTPTPAEPAPPRPPGAPYQDSAGRWRDPQGRFIQAPTNTVPGEVAPPRPPAPAPGAPAAPPAPEIPGTPPPNAAAGTASRMSNVAGAVKAGARQVRGGGIIGSLFGVVLNEITSVSELQDLRKQTIEKYRKGEISREDAEKALKEIDDQIAESRGGSLTRGAVSGAGGAIGGLAGAVAGGGVASAVTGTAGVIGGSMIADKFLGGAAERAGGWISRQLFGASNRGINRELDAIQPTTGSQPSAGQQSIPEGATPIRENGQIIGYMAEGGGIVAMPGMEDRLRRYQESARRSQPGVTPTSPTGPGAAATGAVAGAVAGAVVASPGTNTNASASGAQPGRMTQTSSTSRIEIAGKPVVQGQPLAPDQMAAIGMALSMSPDNARRYPAWVLEQYNRQKSQGAVGSVTPGAVGATAAAGALNRPNDITQTSTDENEIYNALMANYPSNFANDSGVQQDARQEARMQAEANRRRSGSSRGNVQTPSGSTGIGSVTSGAIGALGASSSDSSSADSQQLAEKARVEQTQTDIRTLAEQQAQTNQILTAMLNKQDQVAGDSRRTVDVLENLNNKT